MKMTLDDLRAVVEVADRQSFNRAADALGVTQSALSRRIAKTESYLRAALFERTTQKVTLLPLGKPFVERARTLLNDIDQFDTEVLSMASGANTVIEMSCLRTVAGSIMPRLIRRFRDEHERVRFHVRDDNGIRALERVANHEVEFGLSIQLPEGPMLEFEPLAKEPFVLCCAPGHHLWDDKPISWREILAEDVAFMGGTAANRLLLQSALRDHGLTTMWNDEVESFPTQMGFVEEGVVAAVLPQLGIAYGRNPGLCMRPLVEPYVERTIGIFTRKHWRPSDVSAQFVSFVRENFIKVYEEVTNGAGQKPETN